MKENFLIRKKKSCKSIKNIVRNSMSKKTFEFEKKFEINEIFEFVENDVKLLNTRKFLNSKKSIKNLI